MAIDSKLLEELFLTIIQTGNILFGKKHVAPLPIHHSASLCKSIFLSKPKEITSPSKSTFKQTVFFTDFVVYLWIFHKPNAFFAVLKTSSMRDLFSINWISSRRYITNRRAREVYLSMSCFVSDLPKIQRGKLCFPSNLENEKFLLAKISGTMLNSKIPST